MAALAALAALAFVFGFGIEPAVVPVPFRESLWFPVLVLGLVLVLVLVLVDGLGLEGLLGRWRRRPEDACAGRSGAGALRDSWVKKERTSLRSGLRRVRGLRRRLREEKSAEDVDEMAEEAVEAVEVDEVRRETPGEAVSSTRAVVARRKARRMRKK